MLRKTLTVLATAALAVGVASPALASNEVRITVDPLNWSWSGQVQVPTNPDAFIDRLDPNAWSGFGSEFAPYKADFSVQPGAGPQWVATRQVEWLRADYVAVVGSDFSAGDVVIEDLMNLAIVQNPHFGEMRLMPFRLGMGDLTREKSGLFIRAALAKSEDPETGKGFYELKFFPNREATAEELASTPATDHALMNLHEVQAGGVSPEDCTVSRTLEPGDTLATGDANDVVCVTLSDGDGDGDGSSSDPILIETGDGNDVVLVDGDTDAKVVMDKGRGNDVVVVDTDADVEVRGGDGHDAVVEGANTVTISGAGNDRVIGSAMSDCKFIYFAGGFPRCAD